MTTNWSQKVQKSILKKPCELTKIQSDGILNAFGLYNARIWNCAEVREFQRSLKLLIRQYNKQKK